MLKRRGSGRVRILRSGLLVEYAIILRDPTWKHTELLGNAGFASSGAYRVIGKRRYPLYVTPAMAKDMFDLWDTAGLRRVGFNC